MNKLENINIYVCKNASKWPTMAIKNCLDISIKSVPCVYLTLIMIMLLTPIKMLPSFL